MRKILVAVVGFVVIGFVVAGLTGVIRAQEQPSGAAEDEPDPPPLTSTTTAAMTTTTATAPPNLAPTTTTTIVSANPARIRIDDVDIPPYQEVIYHESQRYALVVQFQDTHQLALAYRTWTAGDNRVVVKITSPSTHIEGHFRLATRRVALVPDRPAEIIYYFTQTTSDTH